MGETSIEWCHYTFNHVLGCAKVHTGCTHCYAEKAPAVVLRQGGRVQWGEVWQGGQRAVVSDSTWAQPYQWARAAARAGERRRVFCASLADVLEVPTWPSSWPSSWTGQQIADAVAHVGAVRAALERARERLWGVIRETWRTCGDCGRRQPRGKAHPIHHLGCRRPTEGGLDWLLLTKRPENWRLVPEDVRPLVWLGTSVSDQETADELVPRLLDADGFRLRFLSLEPLVGLVDLEAFLPPDWDPHDGIDWVIVGGESGTKARPCNVKDVRRAVEQCKEVGVPCFVKQLGANYVDAANGVGGRQARPPPEYGPLTRRLSDPKGGDPAEWPEDLRVRQLPEVSHG